MNKLRIRNFLIIGIPLILFLYVGVARVISHYPLYDDAYNASVAKNLSSGFGYASSYHEKIPFNPEVTTGPSLILPAAILIKIFGNKYWVPAFTSLLISFSLFFVITRNLLFYFGKTQIKNLNSKENSRQYTISLILLSFLLIPEIRKIEFLGEFPSALFVCAGALIIFKSELNKSEILTGGFFLGLSITSKFIAIIFIIPLIIIWSFYILFGDDKKVNFKSKLFDVSIFLLSIIMPSLLFELYMLITLGFEQYKNLQQIEREFFNSHGSGIKEILASNNFIDYLISNLRNNFSVLRNETFGIFIFFAFLISNTLEFSSLILKSKKKSNLTKINFLAIALFGATIFMLIWWLLISPQGWIRTVSPVFTVASLSIVISITAFMKKKAEIVLFALLIFWIVYAPVELSASFAPPKIPKDLINSTENTVEYITKLEEKDKELLGCGWWANRRLEYFLEKPLNFNQCFLSQFEKAILVVDMQFWNWENNQYIIDIENRCSQLLFEDYPYMIYQCQ